MCHPYILVVFLFNVQHGTDPPNILLSVDNGCHDTWYTEMSLVTSATNILSLCEPDAIQFILDPWLISWAIPTALAFASRLGSAPEAPLHVLPHKFQVTILLSSPPDTNKLFGRNLAKWTCVTLEECFFRHSSGINFFLPSNLKSWMLPLPAKETLLLKFFSTINHYKAKDKLTRVLKLFRVLNNLTVKV